THEIGLRKSLGATRGDIRRQFLVEAIVLSSLGGVQGVLAGWALAAVVSTFTPLPARITLWSVAVALALGGSAGVILGVFPASRAARLVPITSLRAEERRLPPRLGIRNVGEGVGIAFDALRANKLRSGLTIL